MMGPMGLLGLGLVVLVIAFIVYLLIEAVFIYGGAKLAGVENASFGKAFIVALALVILMPIFGAIFHLVFFFIPIVGKLLAMLLTFIAGLWIVKVIFSTSWIKALITTLMAFILAIIAAFILGAILGLSLFAFL